MTIQPLRDKDRIFTNLYGYQSPDLQAAQARGDWDQTAELMKQGPDAIIAAFLAFKFIAGMVTFVVLAAIVIAVAWFLMNGGLGA